MSSLRPLFVVRRFWPWMDGAARSVADLAAALVERGMTATVVTLQPHPLWPTEISCRGVRVVRLPMPEQGLLAQWRHARVLSRWLRDHRDQYDLVYVSSLGSDAATAIRAVGGSVPVVLRAERSGRGGDCLRQIESRRGRRIKRRCMKADALIGPSRLIHEELLAAGYPRRRVHLIPHGTPSRPARTRETRQAARSSLADCHPELRLVPTAPLAIYTGALERRKDLERLVPAWRPIVAQWPNARLWLAGRGPARQAIVARIRELGLSDRVVPLGAFDAVDTLLDAADLFVSPSPDEDLPLSVLEAMAAGLPVVATDIPGNREAITDGATGLLVPPGDTTSLSAAMHRLIDDPDLSARLAAAAHAAVEARFPLAKTVEAHVSLLEGLVG